MSDLSFFSKNKGSFIVAAAFFMLIFLMIGSFAIDLSNYFLRRQTTQSIAEGAALTAANEFNQVRSLNNIDQKRIVNATMQYIKHHSPETDLAGSYDTSPYEVSPEMTPGEFDIQYDSFSRNANASGNVPNSFAFTQSGGELRTMKGDETQVKDRAPAGNLALGPSRVDFNSNGVNDVALLKNSTTIELWDTEDGEHTTISLTGDPARTSKSLIGVGEFNGQTGIYYAGNNEENIYRVSPSSGPTEVVNNPDGDGTNAVAGIGDVDGDGQSELVYADASQEIKVAEPSGSVTETGVTAGSNNNIGIGQPADFDGDGTASIPIVDGGNEIRLLGPGGVRQTILDGAVADREAEKSPISAVNVDDDQSMEIVYQRSDDNNLRYVDNVTVSNTPENINDASGNRVSAESTRGVVGAGSGSSDPFYRIGVQVMTTWKPYFLPREVFGEGFHLVNATAVAEAVPKFREASCEGPPQRAWGDGMYSEQNIKVNGIDGDVDINSNMCARDGSVNVKKAGKTGDFEMNGDIRAEGGKVHVKKMDDVNSVTMDGDITSGDGNIKLKDHPDESSYDGDWYANNGSIDNSAGVIHTGSEDSDGSALSESEKTCGVDAPDPGSIPSPSCSNVADSYGLDINEADCTSGSSGTCDASATFIKCDKTQDAVDAFASSDIELNNQMLYITDNADIKEGGSGNDIHEITGNGQLVADTKVHLRNDPEINGELDLVALNGKIQFNNVDDPMNLKGNLIAPNAKIQFTKVDAKINITGSAYTGQNKLQFNNMSGGFEFNSEDFCSVGNASSIFCRPSSQTCDEQWSYAWDVYLTD